MLFWGEKNFQEIRLLRDPKGETEVYNFLMKINLKVSFLRLKIMHIRLLNNCKMAVKKSSKRFFWSWKLSKWPSQRAKFSPKIYISEAIYQPLELKIQPKRDLLKPKIIPKQLLNNSKPTFKKSKKPIFLPWKLSQ